MKALKIIAALAACAFDIFMIIIRKM